MNFKITPGGVKGECVFCGGGLVESKPDYIRYKCPSCGTTANRVDWQRGKPIKCYRCGMLMLEVV